MTADTRIDTLERDLARLEAAITQECTQIASVLARPLPTDSARISASQRRIAVLVRDVMALLPLFDRLESALAAEARDLSEAQGGPVRLPQHWYALRARINRVRSDMNQWHEVGALLARQTPPRSRPLYQPREDLPEALITQAEVGDAVLNSLHRLINPAEQAQAAHAHGCHADIALSQTAFLEHAHAAYRLRLAQRRRTPARFLDVGCGAGLKVVTAIEFFPCSDGLEYDPGYARAAQSLFGAMGLGQCRVIEGDAMAFEGYDDYDVVYFYRPMRDLDATRALEARIAVAVRPGTILIAAYDGFAARHADFGCAHVAGNLFLAHTSEEDAAELRRVAEHTGPFVRRRETALTSVWEPILSASHANGYGLRRATPIRV
jgi:SAM-dependent methyltransferase